jgi:ferritin-like protein
LDSAGALLSTSRIGITGDGTPGATTGGNAVNSNNLVFTQNVAMEIGQDERAHVTLIRGALQAASIMPVAKPAINLNALAIGFANEGQFLILARVFEDIGVTAYAAEASVSSVANSPYIGTAARILATEAEHVRNIRLQCAPLGIATTALDGVDFPPPPSDPNFISADNTTGLVSVRTPGQVLFLAYGSVANATSFGFFPKGVNGNLRTSSASA